jgi:uncharacterized membrane protein
MSIDAKPQHHARPPEWLSRAIATLERDSRLDRISEPLGRIATPLAQGPAGSALRGEWLGHALHPALTDLPIGCWTAAWLLDFVGGKSSRKAAQRLIGLGLLAVPATAAAGLVDWKSIEQPRDRRVATVHAVGNVAVTACYWKSWRARRSGRHFRGVMWGNAGGALATATAHLGAHLSFARGVGQVEHDAGTDLLLDEAFVDEAIDTQRPIPV